jgi:hypothetical protein
MRSFNIKQKIIRLMIFFLWVVIITGCRTDDDEDEIFHPPFEFSKLHAEGTKLYNAAGEEAYLQAMLIDWNARMKKQDTLDLASNPEESWFTEADVRRISENGGNCIEFHCAWLWEIMPEKNIINEEYFNVWVDKWVEWCRQNEIYFIFNIAGLALEPWGPTYPDWLWEGLYPEPVTYEEAAEVMGTFYDVNDSTMDENRQAFINVWRYIAERYENEEHVICSLMNEPVHAVGSPEFDDFLKPDYEAMVYYGGCYKTLCEMIIDGIRGVDDSALVIVDRPFVFGADTLKPVDRDNIIWEVHIFWGGEDMLYENFISQADSAVQEFVSDFNKPLFIGEYSCIPPNFSGWQQALTNMTDYLNKVPLCGKQFLSWGDMEGEHYDFIHDFYTREESDFILQTVLGW